MQLAGQFCQTAPCIHPLVQGKSVLLALMIKLSFHRAQCSLFMLLILVIETTSPPSSLKFASLTGTNCPRKYYFQLYLGHLVVVSGGESLSQMGIKPCFLEMFWKIVGKYHVHWIKMSMFAHAHVFCKLYTPHNTVVNLVF